MAKATKSGSGSTSKSQASKASADKADKVDNKTSADADKTSGASSASKAASGQSKSAAQKSAASAAAAKDVKSTSAKSKSSDAKTTTDSKSDAAKADTSKPKEAPTGPSAAKSASTDTAAKAETASKPETKDTAKVETKPATSVPATPVTPKPEPTPQRRSIFLPLVLGGILAGVIGFAISEMNVLNTRVDVAAIEDRLSAQQDQIAALEEAEAPAAPDLSGIEASIAALSETVSALEAELEELASRPAPTGDGSAPAVDYSAEFEAMQNSIAAQQEEIARLLDNAQSVEEATAEAARNAAIQTALTRITAAVSSGSGYEDALTELQDAGVSDVPEPLAETASDGVPTLTKLQSDFPDSARAALGAARAAGAASGEQGFGGFLRRQLGARSTAPREGNDPDAILSRAEAAVRDGQVGAALAELDALPAEAQAAMEDWLVGARARAEAEAAIGDLSQRLTAN